MMDTPIEWARVDAPPDSLAVAAQAVEASHELDRGAAARAGHLGGLPEPEWWGLDPQPEGEDVYAVVRGDGGGGGPFRLSLYVVNDDAPRWPSFPEWARLADVACLRGASLSCGYLAGMGFPVREGAVRELHVVQVGAFNNTEASQALAAATGRAGA